MNLNITESFEATTLIHNRFHICEKRSLELKNFVIKVTVEGIIEQNKTRLPMDLVEQYKKIAIFCQNLEEYTFSLHLFIFSSARNGILDTEIK